MPTNKLISFVSFWFFNCSQGDCDMLQGTPSQPEIEVPLLEFIKMEFHFYF